jgi:hypothetical protein
MLSAHSSHNCALMNPMGFSGGLTEAFPGKTWMELWVVGCGETSPDHASCRFEFAFCLHRGSARCLFGSTRLILVEGILRGMLKILYIMTQNATAVS